MRLLLILNTIFEFAVGAAMIALSSFGIAGETSKLAIAIARVLAGNALGLGALSLGMIYSRDRQAGLIALSIFHSVVVIAQTINLWEGIVPFPVLIVHSGFAVSFIFFSVTSKRLEKQ